MVATTLSSVCLESRLAGLQSSSGADRHAGSRCQCEQKTDQTFMGEDSLQIEWGKARRVGIANENAKFQIEYAGQ